MAGGGGEEGAEQGRPPWAAMATGVRGGEGAQKGRPARAAMAAAATGRDFAVGETRGGGHRHRGR
jgi:hypothetical protein